MGIANPFIFRRPDLDHISPPADGTLRVQLLDEREQFWHVFHHKRPVLGNLLAVALRMQQSHAATPSNCSRVILRASITAGGMISRPRVVSPHTDAIAASNKSSPMFRSAILNDE